ncbi:MAG: hypothetical protein KDC66_01170 [Phaeodactylibacter sp.]|nr:hypothetical protein [Phaeodactylibacter sp.]MCB9273152.1 hypothetical protein [Lewinellaceae bacterium]
MNRTTLAKWAAFCCALSLVALQGCYEPQEGCLDVEAVNYDLQADKNNSSECVYPELRLVLQHVYSNGDTTYRLGLADSIYYDSQGHPFRINAIRFFLSNCHLIFADGREAEVGESIEIGILQPDGSTLLREIEDNFSLASPRVSQAYTIGTLREVGEVKELRFALGVEGLANLALPDAFPDNHPLGLVDSSLYFNQDSGYVFQYVELFRDTVASDTIPTVLRIGTTPYLKEVRLPVAFTKTRGYHLKATLQVDYAKWFSGIDAQQDSPQALIGKIVANQAQAFSIVDIKLEAN